VDVIGVDADDAATRTLLSELAVEDGDRVVHVLESSRLLRGAAADLDGWTEAEIRQLATFLGSPAAATAAYLLAMAVGVDERRRDALDELHRLVVDLLRHPEVLGAGADALAAVRRTAAESMSTEPAAIERLRAAPVSFLLSHEPDELARQARLLEPLPGAGVVRVAVSPEPTPDHWLVDVACRDAVGLLARLCHALTDSGCDIVSATVATWPDGGVVDTFLVRSAVRPKARTLAERMERSMRERLVAPALTGATATFDNDALPWHTSCVVSAPDRPGSLAAVAAAFASAGIAVHSARIGADEGRLADRFAVTDRHGRKLDDRAMARVEAALAGTPGRRSLFSSRR
jgi:UTP:GlnB (protein PII) uridylyltransferase